MPAYQPYAFSVSNVQNYFSQLNTIAEKIARDIDNTKTTYGKLWHTLAASEQDEIINETLIQPEITIKYYKANIPQNNTAGTLLNSPASTLEVQRTNKNNSSKCKATSTDSADSLTALICSNSYDDTHSAKCAAALSLSCSVGLQCYSYDKRNLHTYAQQVTALKVIQDETFGAYRDEHSAPFSYRTRSQVNLLLFVPATTILQNNESVGSRMCIKTQEKNSRTCTAPQVAAHTQTDSSTKDLKALAKLNTDNSKTKSSCPSVALATLATSTLPQRIANDNFDITDTYFAETDQLVQHIKSSSQLTVSTSSAVSTDDEDDKTLCMENVKLLHSDSDMRKGFDFLNNW